MSFLARLSLSLVLVPSVRAATDPGQAKLQKMEQMEAASASNIIVFTEKDYAEMVLDNPRPYHVVVLYTVSKHCDHCDEMYPEYINAVFSFKNQEEKIPIKTFYGVIYH